MWIVCSRTTVRTTRRTRPTETTTRSTATAATKRTIRGNGCAGVERLRRIALCGLRELARDFGHLVGAGRPAVVEAHRRMRVAVLGVGVHDGCGVAGLALAGVLESVDRREREAVAAVVGELVGPVAVLHGRGPDDPFAGRDLEDASRARIIEIVRARHARVEYAAGPQVDLDFGCLVGPRRPPALDMLGVGPCLPHQ